MEAGKSVSLRLATSDFATRNPNPVPRSIENIRDLDAARDHR
jgi:hypothetical protein